MSDIRLLKESDVLEAMRLSAAAGWNQIPPDWRRLLELEPTGCFGLDLDGRLAATATAVCFGERLSWIGMVLTDPEHRRKGLARQLMEHALQYAENRGIDWIKLDATEMGLPLYERLGFEAEGGIERWSAVAPSGARNASGGVFQLDAELDLQAFGADRTPTLANLARGEALALDGGYAMGRPGARAASFGPCVARSADTARKLAEWFLRCHSSETIYWDLLPQNRSAAELAAELGFACSRRLIRMVRPGKPGASPLLFDNSLVYATSGFEYG